ncbi:thiosulfate/3-mercaptopyruvate sulfurtransferase [Actinocorallia herbida]|uniref:Thiosulfate/3-mercaptopyruvate sulfurtransferase n=1 Tax=Actinocorallia herbida TaxID=58109 RepID=A0A3N1D645_9ACTN|nr:sulfurtransferase [Actinocorallia herbida]ROO89007.1 thiosulfate/3-mercaptopyruvate sulfurtransferase [Actinocorallia herbida]
MPELPPVVAADDPIVSAGRLADVRWYLDGSDGHAAYLAGHIPGAVWVDLDTVLAGPPTEAGGRHPLPSPEAFAESLGALGFDDRTPVIAYDDAGGGYAARLVWLLRRIGAPAALLDGGLAAWPGALATGEETLAPAVRTAVPWPRSALRDADEVAEAVRTGSAVVLDARAADRYSGAAVLPSDARSGHIPGARNAPWAANLDEDGRFHAPDVLRSRFDAAGIAADTDVIVYCGSGVTACHDLLALERAGLTSTALYPGSWSAWSADLSRAVTTSTDSTQGEP